jgi:hypothetical protein
MNLEPLESRIVPAVFNVNNTLDIIPHPGNVTLRSAIEAANNTAGNNTINLTVPGTYEITMVGTPGEADNLAGEFAIFPNAASPPNSTLLIDNTSGGTVIVDANQLNRVFDINPGNTSNPATKLLVTMQGFTIQNGLAADPMNPDAAGSSGGGIRDQGNANLTLTNMVITHCSATADGGGVSMENAPASTPWTLTVNNSTISNNHAGDAGGGLETDGTGSVLINTGSAVSGNTCFNLGAGIFLDPIGTGSANLTMNGVVVSNNSAQSGQGGGIGNAGDGAVTIENSTVSNNFSGADGGGFGDLNNLDTLTVLNSVFEGNTAKGNGGGIHAGGPSTMITHSKITGNSSGSLGGGVTADGATTELTIAASEITGNSSTDSGGGVAANGTSTTITDSEIDGNSSGGSGGGVFSTASTLTILRATVADNTSGLDGGGIEVETTGSGTAGSTITDATITGNRALNNAGANGGGIDAPTAFSGALSLLNDTINGNFATVGGGIFWTFSGTSTFDVKNTIVAHNAASNAGPDALASVPFADGGGNLIGVSGAGSGNTGFTAATTQTGTVVAPLDPLLGPLQDNGGLTIGPPGPTPSSMGLLTEAPLRLSPALAKGVVSGAPPTDERGFPSVVNNNVNVGAVAEQAFFAAAAGSGSRVNVYDTATGALKFSFLAFDPSFTGGVRVAVGDINGDGVSDIIVASGPGQAPLVKVIDGTKLSQLQANGEIADSALLAKFDAYSPFFLGGVNVAYGLGRNGVPELITGAGPGGGPHVLVIDGTKLDVLLPNGQIAPSALLGTSYAYSPFFTGGVNVAAGDVNGDGVIDVITGAGPGGGPHVKVIDGTKLNDLQNNSEIAPSALLASFFAYSPFFTGGVSVAFGEGINGEPELITGAGAGGSPHVKVIDGTKLSQHQANGEIADSALLAQFYAYDPAFTGGVRVAAADLNGDGVIDVLLGPGPGTPQTLKLVDGTQLNDLQSNAEIANSALLDNFFAFGSSFKDGIFVGGS